MGNKNFCEACLTCKKHWAADSKTTCHDVCEEYQKWKNPFETVYLGGAIDKATPEFATEWRKEATIILQKHNFKVLDPTAGKDLYNLPPMTSTYANQIVNSDLKMINESDILLIEMSRIDMPYHGSSMEMVYGYLANKKQFVWGGCTSGWVIYHADQIFLKMEEALSHIINMKRRNEVITR